MSDAPASTRAGMSRLTGRTILLTGALGGLGGPMAQRLAAEGGTVVLADLADADDVAVVEAVEAVGGGARYLKLDVTSAADWQAAAASLASGSGLNVLINNAGVAPTGSIRDASPADWQRTMAVNCEGAFIGLKVLAPLLSRGAEASGSWSSVINLSSILGLVGYADSSAYAASKGAIRAFSRAAAVELRAPATGSASTRCTPASSAHR